MYEVSKLFLLMCCGHALADFPLQGTYIALHKNPNKSLSETPWIWPMLAHCLIHGLAVYLVTQSLALLCVEALAHFRIDYDKCNKLFSYTEDQALHYLCKAIWALLAVYAMGVQQ